MTNIKHQNFPQMKNYDEMPAGEVAPFSMLKGPSNYTSKEVNTDQEGFRFSYCGDDKKSFSNFDTSEEINVLIGASTAFGVGSTSDEFTLSSLLMKNTKETWINLGVRGCVSLQEYLYLLKLIERTQKVKRIIFLSGINDLYINTLEGKPDFFDNRFQSFNSNLSFYSPQRITYTYLKSLFSRKSFNELLIGDKQLNRSTELNGIDITLEKYKRNFLLYKSLSMSLGVLPIFILQPFIFWTDKKISSKEKSTIKYLENIQSKTNWPEVSKILKEENYYVGYSQGLKKLAKENNLKFFDSNKWIETGETIFCDSVHLNDLGNNILYECIIGEL